MMPPGTRKSVVKRFLTHYYGLQGGFVECHRRTAQYFPAKVSFLTASTLTGQATSAYHEHLILLSWTA